MEMQEMPTYHEKATKVQKKMHLSPNHCNFPEKKTSLQSLHLSKPSLFALHQWSLMMMML